MSATKAAGSRRLRTARLVFWIVVALVIALIGAVAVALVSTSQSSYFVKYKGLARRHTMLESSSHKDLPCTACHATAGGPVVEGAELVGEFYSSLFETTPTLTFVKFAPPRSEACLACHQLDWSDQSALTGKIPHPAHLRVQDETRNCVDCHKWIAHEEAYQAKHKTMPFSAVCASFGCHVGTKSKSDCANCHHILQPSTAVWRANHPTVVLKIGTDACTEKCHTSDQCVYCHTTGKTPVISSDFATASANVAAIGQQHTEATWLTAHGTLALAQPTLCKTCHVSYGECQDCHALRPAFHGSTTTWLKAHQTLGTNTARCLTCHVQPFCDACHQQFKQTH